MTDTRRWVAWRQPWLRRAGMAVLVIAVGYVVYGQVSTQLRANEAQDQAQEARQDAKEVADPLADLCRRDAEVRRRVGSLCDKAAQVQESTAAPRDGKDGRGVASTSIVEGHLWITYTDGVSEDKGPVVSQGQPGRDGRSIVSTAIQDGALVLSYSDGATETAGQVVGENGRDGTDGRGVASVAVTADYRLTVTYTDGETVDVGPLPAGRDGTDGRGIASIAFDMDACTATVTYTDGATETKPMTGCDNDTPSGNPTLLPLPGG